MSERYLLGGREFGAAEHRELPFFSALLAVASSQRMAPPRAPAPLNLIRFHKPVSGPSIRGADFHLRGQANKPTNKGHWSHPNLSYTRNLLFVQRCVRSERSRPKAFQPFGISIHNFHHHRPALLLTLSAASASHTLPAPALSSKYTFLPPLALRRMSVMLISGQTSNHVHPIPKNP